MKSKILIKMIIIKVQKRKAIQIKKYYELNLQRKEEGEGKKDILEDQHLKMMMTTIRLRQIEPLISESKIEMNWKDFISWKNPEEIYLQKMVKK